MLPWLAFSEAVGRAPCGDAGASQFRQEAGVRGGDAAGEPGGLRAGDEFFALVLFCAFLLVLARHGMPPTVLWLPVLLVPQVLFTAGVSWFLAALGVFVRDLGQIIGFLLTSGSSSRPSAIRRTSLPHGRAASALEESDLRAGARLPRDFPGGQAPAFGPLWKLWLLAAVVFVLGHAWFYKLRKSFADMI